MAGVEAFAGIGKIRFEGPSTKHMLAFRHETGDTPMSRHTDQFPTSIHLTTQNWSPILEHGGPASGGVHFDARARRESFEPVDRFHAHVGGMDAFARGHHRRSSGTFRERHQHYL